MFKFSAHPFLKNVSGGSQARSKSLLATGEGLKILSRRGSLVRIRPAAPSPCQTAQKTPAVLQSSVLQIPETCNWSDYEGAVMRREMHCYFVFLVSCLQSGLAAAAGMTTVLLTLQSYLSQL